MEGELVINYLLIVIGATTLIASFLNWDWLVKSQKKAGFIRMLDRNGARVFNFMLGILMLLVGSFDYLFPAIR